MYELSFGIWYTIMSKNVRIDKYIANLGLIPRRSVWKAIANGAILLDGEIVTKSDQKVSYGQVLTVYDQDIVVKEFVYVLLHKPAGYVSSEIDEGWHLSYKNLLTDCPYGNLLHVAGRLDFDTEWVLLCSNDWQWTHSIISPKKQLEKQYYVQTANPLSIDDLHKLEAGITLEDGYKTLPAKAAFIDNDTTKLYLTITEGKFHQVKRMIQAVWSEVVYLRRDRIGQWTLDGLHKWEWKYIEG